MSKTIDERVVEMKFENGQFESNVKQSMSTIEKLKSALNFKNDSAGLEDTSKAVTKATSGMGTFGDSIETVKAKFSALDVMAMTALANITNSAVNAGKKIVSALAIDPITTGFQEYETKINAVQTIMANVSAKGKTIEDVTAVLDELNRYADLTIYNFTEMTKNIGTFTAAGVDLNVAVDAIQGIANLAATSGSTSQQASTAMYQLSQAIAAGTVKLQDWNSVVNAGMGGETFQNGLKETAREMGIAVDQIIEDSGSFRESLSKNWLTADVLNTTLKKFTVDGAKEYCAAMEASGQYTAEQSAKVLEQAQVMEDAATKIKTFTQLWDVLKESAQSGWTTTWELIIGDFEQAKESLSKLGDILTGVINGFSDARNDLLSAALGGGGTSAWSELESEVNKAGIDLEEFKDKLVEVGKAHGVVTDEMIDNAGSFEASLKDGWLDTSIFKEVLTSFSESGDAVSASTEDMTAKLEKFQKVVDEVWAGNWGNAPERYQKLADAGYDYAKVQELVNKTVDGHKLTLEDLGEAEMEAIGFTEEQIAIMKDLQAQCDDTGSSVSQLISNITRPSGRELLWESLFNIIEAVGKALGAVRDAYREVFPATTAEQVYNVVEAFHSFTEWLIMSDEQAQNLKTTFRGLFSVLRLLTTTVKTGITLAFKGISTILSNVNVDILKYTSILGEALTRMSEFRLSADQINDIFEKVKSGANTLVSAIGSLVTSFMSLESVQTVVQKLVDEFGDKLDMLKELFGEAGDGFAEFVEQLKDTDFANGFSLDTLIELLEAFKAKVLDEVVDIQDVFDTLVVNVKGIPNDIKTGATKLHSGLSFLLDKLNIFVDALQEHIRPNINLGEILAVGLGGSSIYFIKQMGSLLEKLKGPMDALEGAITNFGKIGTSISGYFNALTKEVKVEMIQGIAKALLMLAGALVAIAAIPSDKLAVACGVLVGLGAGLVALGYAFDKIGDTKGIISLSVSMLSLAGAVAILANALSTISDVAAGGHLVSSIVSLGLIIAAVAGVLVIASKCSSSFGAFSIASLAPSLLALVAVCGALKLLVSAIQDISGLAVGDVATSVLALVAVVAAIRLVLAAMSGVSIGSAAGMVAAVMAIVAFAKALEYITVLDMDSVIGAIPQLIVIVTMFAALLAATKLAGKHAIQAGVSLAAMALAVVLLTEAMKGLADLSGMDLDGASTAMAKVMVCIGLIIAATNLAGKYSIRAGIAIVAMCAGLMMLSGAIAVLSQLDPNGVDVATTALMKLQAMFVALVAVSKFATGTKLTIIALVTSITILAAAVAALAMVDPASVKNATACVTAILAMFAVVVAASQFAHECAGTMIAISLVLAELAGIFYLIAQLDAPNALNNCAALSLVTASLATLVASTALIKPMTKNSFAAMQSMILIIAELALVLKAIEALNINVDSSQLLALAEISAIFAALTTVLGVVGGWGKFSSVGAIKAAAGMAGVIGVLGTVMVAVGDLADALDQNGINLAGKIQSGMEVLNSVAIGIGEFFGNLVGGFKAGQTAGLAEASTNLAGFITTLGSVDAGAVTNFKSVIEALGDLYKTQALGQLLTDKKRGAPLESFSSDMSTLGDGLQTFVSSVAGITAEDIEPAASAMEAIATLMDVIPESGGLKQLFTGTKDLGSFGDSLSSFMTNLKPVLTGLNSEEFANFDAGETGPLTKLSAITEALGGLTEFIEPIGGLNAALQGSSDLGAFGATLAPFIEGIELVITSLDTKKLASFQTDQLGTLCTVVETLGGLTEHIEPIGGLVSALKGHTDLGTFGETVVTFVESFVEIDKALSESDLVSLSEGGKLEAIVKACESLTAIQTSLEGSGGLKGAIFGGTKDLGDFGSQVASLIEHMAQAFSVISKYDATDFDVSKIEAIAAGAASLATLQDVIDPEQPLWQKIKDGDSSLSNFAGQIESVVRHLSDAFTQLNEADIDVSGVDQIVSACSKLQTINFAQNGDGGSTDGLKQLATGIRSLGTAFKDVDTTSLGAAATGLRNLATVAHDIATVDFAGLDQFATKLKDIAATSVDGFVDTLSNAQGRVRNAVATMTQGLSTGIADSAASVTTATTAIVTSISNTISSSASTIQTAAYEIGNTIADGIDQGSVTVTSSISDVMSKCADTIRSAYSSFESAGEYAASGLAAGIEAQQASAVAAAKAMAAAVTNAARVELDINSPSKVFTKIGKYVCQGLANGLEKNTKIATDESVDTAKAIVKAFQKELEINSPSKVTRDKVGKYIVDGIAEGIEKTMTAEEAAAQKAQNICNAFKEEIDHFDLRTTTQSLEYQLWQALNPNASESVASAKAMEDMQKRLALQAEKVTLYKGQYETMLATLGANADETREAYNEYLQAQIDMLAISQEIADVETDQLDVNREAFKSANELYGQVHDGMVKLGYTSDEIWKYCTEKFGYKDSISLLDSSLQETKTALDITNESLATANGTVAKYKEAAKNDAEYIYATSEGITAAVVDVKESLSDLSSVTSQESSVFTDTVSGLEDLQTVLNQLISTDAGKKVSNELIRALSLLPEDVEGAADITVDSFLEALNQLLDACDQNGLLDPVISPVVDLTDAYAKFDQLNRMFNNLGSTSSSSSSGSTTSKFVGATAGTVKSSSGRTVKSATADMAAAGVSLTYIQNNTSPKALDRSAIYRDTKTLLSTTKVTS